jgi:hypothetical protein
MSFSKVADALTSVYVWQRIFEECDEENEEYVELVMENRNNSIYRLESMHARHGYII